LIKDFENHYILNGEYINLNSDLKQISRLFFNNKQSDNINYLLLKKYTKIKILFYTCTFINN
jgi:hypothetical protein